MTRSDPPFATRAVEMAFAEFPEAVRPVLLGLRGLIFDEARLTPDVGRIEETLKWGQPAYLTPETRFGTTLRLGVGKGGEASLFVHCQTTILSDFRSLFPDDFTYEGTRAVRLPGDLPVPEAPLRLLVRSALIYHAGRRGRG